MRENIIQQMRDHGLTGITAVDLIVDGGIQRFKPDWERKPSKKRAWYILFEFRTDTGIQLISGSYGWFKGAENYKFDVALGSKTPLSPTEQARLAREQAQKRKIAEQERLKTEAATAKRAAEIWANLPDTGKSDYLQRKKVYAFGIRFSRGSIVLTVQDVDGNLSGLQFIAGNGDKKFLTGTVKKGRFFLIGTVKNPAGPLAIAEGYATAASIHMAVQWPVFVAFDAGNLLDVALTVRQRYPLAHIVICGDDDYGKPDNPGRSKAEAAAHAVDGIAVFPSMEIKAA